MRKEECEGKHEGEGEEGREVGRDHEMEKESVVSTRPQPEPSCDR